MASGAIAVAQIDSIASQALVDGHAPGLAVVVLERDEIRLATGYGFADSAATEPVTANTVFQLGSISKSFLAALVMRLAEEKRLSIDDPVVRHLPELRRFPRSLLVRHLLSHTSGIRELFVIPEYQAGIEDPRRSVEELRRIVETAPADFEPGSRWSYSNTNYTILAFLVERLTGRPYENVLAEAFFRPHGLSTLRHCTPTRLGPGEAVGHVWNGEKVVPSAPENMNWTRGDGGMCGGALDVARWFRGLAMGRIVDKGSYRAMTRPTPVGNSGEADYGFALSLVPLDGVAKVAHNGAMLGFSASAAYYPAREITVVVLTNRGNVRTEAIERRMARTILGLPAPKFEERRLSSAGRRRFTGTYDIGVFRVRITERGDELWVEMPPPGPTTRLLYLGAGRFAGEEEPDAYRLTFPSRGDARTFRLSMGAMHWYGVRVEEALLR